MNMKKIAILALSLCMIAAVAVTGTIAYFTDTDAKDNVFTIGNVDVTLDEEYEEGTIVPDETTKTGKVVNVTNHGATDAWVRVHIAVPAVMVDHNLDSFNNILHINFSKASAGYGVDDDNYWNWMPEGVEPAKNYKGWAGNGADNFNHYFTNIDGAEYLVFVVTYMDKLAQGETTEQDAMYAFYMDKYTDDLVHLNDDDTANVTYYKPMFTDSSRKTKVEDSWMAFTMTAEDMDAILSVTGDKNDEKNMIKVIAEATQDSTDFAGAYDALDTAFGAAGTYCAFGGEVQDPSALLQNIFSTEELKAYSGEYVFASTGYPELPQE